jgi:adenylate cyclase
MDHRSSSEKPFLEQQRVQRRLAAILAADVVGYSQLMGRDEEGTLARLKALRRSAIDPRIAAHNGRIVKVMGDGILIEFASVVDAVRCALDVQATVAKNEEEVADNLKILFRVGVNLGDVIVDGDDLYGDGVNVAARLQELADPGGILISSTVRDHLEGKIDAHFEDWGEHSVKNIARPIPVWHWSPGGVAAKTVAASAPPADKPSIAVLPFDNMSGDADQEFFADGITEDIITELSRFPDLDVIARNTTFTYKGSSVNVQEVGRGLGVRYVVEGSVRKAGNRVRVTVQLIDAASGNHVWAERYDREMIDIFDLQDDITQRIVATLPGRLEMAVAEHVKRKPLDNMAAYELVLRGKILHHKGTAEDNASGIEALDKAIEIEPDYAPAWAWKACTIGQALARGYTDDPETKLTEAISIAERALALDDNDIESNRIMCEVFVIRKDLAQAERHHDRAYAMNPNDPRLLAQRAELYTWMGRPDEALPWIEKAMQLDPIAADARAHHLGRALHMLGRYDEACRAFERFPLPRFGNSADLAACYAQVGDEAQTKAQAAKVLELKPDFTVQSYLDGLPYAREEDRGRHRDGLLKAGLPEN